jgi:hypothetical protein
MAHIKIKDLKLVSQSVSFLIHCLAYTLAKKFWTSMAWEMPVHYQVPGWAVAQETDLKFQMIRII